LGKACYHSVQIFLLSQLLSKHLNIKIYKTTYNSTCFFYGCETWSLTLKEENRLMVLDATCSMHRGDEKCLQNLSDNARQTVWETM